MRRDLKPLSDETFDLLIIGGGVTGACVARDAALRGLKVALIEKNDSAHTIPNLSMAACAICGISSWD
jgi:glycerol-3-phosphate dehydrogenase